MQAVSQNINYGIVQIKNNVHYLNDKIACGRHFKANVENIEENNIYYDMTGTITLADYGFQTVSVSSAGTSAQCTILSSVTMDGTPICYFQGKRG